MNEIQIVKILEQLPEKMYKVTTSGYRNSFINYGVRLVSIETMTVHDLIFMLRSGYLFFSREEALKSAKEKVEEHNVEYENGNIKTKAYLINK